MKQELQNNLKNFVDTQHKSHTQFKGEFENVRDLKIEFEAKYVQAITESASMKIAHEKELKNIEGIRNQEISLLKEVHETKLEETKL